MRSSFARWTKILVTPLTALAVASVVMAFHASDRDGAAASHASVPEASLDASALRKERRALEARLNAIKPRGGYVVVDRGNNRIYLRRGDSILVDAPASTGSGAILKETGGQKRTWVFDTPAGRFKILEKRADPVWIKPDWAFLEVGEPIPTRLADRRDYAALGEYGLYLGNAYLIHGTLYERMLGRGVTHGCVRVGREPLRLIANQVRVGTRVFIY